MRTRTARIATPVLLVFAAACGRGNLTGIGRGGGSGSDGSPAADRGPNVPDDSGVVGLDRRPPRADVPRGDGDLPDAPVTRWDGGDGGVWRFDGGDWDGGDEECRDNFDCFSRYGQPVCDPNEHGKWSCERTQCLVIPCPARCVGYCEPATSTCRNDCDCDPSTSCIAGSCQVANRPNTCCTNPWCRPGYSCVQPDGHRGQCPLRDAGVKDGSVWWDGGVRADGEVRGDGAVRHDAAVRDAWIPDAWDPDANVSPTPVGAGCSPGGSECGPFGYCVDEQQDFPGGYCTMECDSSSGSICPGDAVCLSVERRSSYCFDGCNASADCRSGYSCLRLGTNSSRVCWPTPGGSTNPVGLPVGSPCQDDQGCAAGLECFDDPRNNWADGYCTKTYCDPQTNPCPQGSQCWAFSGLFSMCLTTCPSGGSQSTCRQDYYCLGPTGGPGVCVSN